MMDRVGRVKPRNLYTVGFDALLKNDCGQNVAEDNGDNASESKLPNVAKSPQKCRLNPLQKKKKSAKQNDTNAAEVSKDLPPLT